MRKKRKFERKKLRNGWVGGMRGAGGGFGGMRIVTLRGVSAGVLCRDSVAARAVQGFVGLHRAV